MSPKNTEEEPLKKTEKEKVRKIYHVSKRIQTYPGDTVKIWKKIHILLLAAIFAAGCTVIVYESPVRRARSVYVQHWQYCPYGGFWGNIYWQYQWYYRYPYYSRILSPGYSFKVRRVITKQQLQKPASTQQTPKKGVSTKVVKKKEVKEKSGKVIKKEKKNER